MGVASTGKQASDRIVKIHTICVLGVCVLFGCLSLARKLYTMGIATIAMGVAAAFVVSVVLKKLPNNKKGFFLTQAVVFIICALSAGQLQCLFTLLIANIAIGCIYYDLKNIQTAWILTNIITIGGAVFHDSVYAGANFDLIAKGIIGINVAAAMMRILLKESVENINNAQEQAQNAKVLTEQVQLQMEEGRAISAKQAETVNQVADVAKILETSSGTMLDVAGRISASADEQSTAVAGIHEGIAELLRDSKQSFEVAENTSDVAIESVRMLDENGATIQKMVDAMQEIHSTSMRINGIIKTIDDIAFQTNILALNAAVEAARAGAAGKGFAVVADEVRNLATKSAEAAKSTGVLIGESVQAVERGTRLAKDVAEQMGGVVECSKRSEEQARRMAELIGHQQAAIAEIENRVQVVSDVISQNSQAALESARIARTVADEVDRMNVIVAK
ncbi:MAG: hypothetical protein IKV41_06935 [Oscillospiraceae bacterium]|nr:hypothetical protein [Oscillospiraceae bacterium]